MSLSEIAFSKKGDSFSSHLMENLIPQDEIFCSPDLSLFSKEEQIQEYIDDKNLYSLTLNENQETSSPIVIFSFLLKIIIFFY